MWGPVDPDTWARVPAPGDLDEDGFSDALGGDCDETDPTIHFCADEVWHDGIDEDCLGGSDDDADGDGYDDAAYG